MKWIKLGTHAVDHPRFLEAKAEGRDLYVWGLAYSGKHETDGELPMVAVLASPWGAGGSANVKTASHLVAIGLWARTDTGFLILRWAEQGNQTKTSLSEKREEGRKRKAEWDERKRNSVGNGVTHSVRNGVSNAVSNAKGSKSMSLSVSSGYGSPASEPVPAPVTVEVPEGSAPEWFATAIEVIAMGTGVSLPVAESWLRYDGHREGKGLARTPKDAQYWLTTVMVPEAREVLRRSSADRERTAAFVQQRSGPEVKPLPSVTPLVRERERWEREAATPEQSAEAAANLRKLLGGVGR